MSDSTVFDGSGEPNTPTETDEHHPKHRLGGGPVDATSSIENLTIEDFGENPDTELAG